MEIFGVKSDRNDRFNTPPLVGMTLANKYLFNV
jgi:hypothetical protein